MNYGITDLAALLGVSTNAIRFYEKQGVIPQRKDAGGRRAYDESDVFRLLSYMKYHSMEIPVREIAEQFGGTEDDRGMILDRERTARDRALEQAEHYRELAEHIEMHIREIERIETLENRYVLEQNPAMLFMQTGENGWIPEDRQRQRKAQIWIENMPEVQLGIALGRRAPFGYLLQADSPKAAVLSDGFNVTYWPPQLCVHTIRCIGEPDLAEPEAVFRDAADYVKARHFSPAGEAWGRILLVEVGQGGSLSIYVDLWIPIS